MFIRLDINYGSILLNGIILQGINSVLFMGDSFFHSSFYLYIY